MDKVRYGIIGLGNQGSHYTNFFMNGEIRDAELTALCDSNPVKIRIMKEKYPEAKVTYFNDYIDLLESGLCDAVLVEVPHYLHPVMVTESLKRGLHVLSDKPAGVYTRQVREMNEFAEQQKSLFGMMFNQRTNCIYRKMKEIIADGGIGRLQRVNWIITDWYRTEYYYASGSWRATWAGEGGGVLFNQCPHQIDLVSWVVGEQPKTVRGFCKYGRWHAIEVEDEVTAYFEYESGATGVFITTTGEAPGTNRFEVSGTGGKLLCENGKLIWYKNAADSLEHSRTSPDSFRKPAVEVIEPETDGRNLQHKGIINNFTQAILGKEKLFVSGTEGINGVELMDAIELSGWKGGAPVTIPVNEEEYLEELNRHIAVSQKKEGNDDVVAGVLNFGTGQDAVETEQRRNLSGCL